jgi:hypothetical protein
VGLLVEDLGYNAGALGVDGTADGSDAQVEELRSDAADLAEVRDLAGAPTRSLVLTVAPSSLAALARSPEALALSASSLVFWASS